MLDYIKTSIEILMNMKMEETDTDKNGGNKSGKGKVKGKQKNETSNSQTNLVSDTESLRSLDEPPKDYEQMLVKYEAEVRNHIKIE